MIAEALVCLALNVYYEARGYPEADQLAVAHVVLNRVNSDRFPDTICEVVKQGGTRRNRCQFSWYCDGKSDTPYEKEAWAMAQRVAEKALTTKDNTGGALFYHAPYVAPAWAKRLTQTRVDDAHVFFKTEQ